MIQKILNTQTKSVSLSTIILAAFYVASGLLGLLRDRLLFGKFGAGNELDVYYAAFTIPDLIALILVFGAISAAIIPIFSGYLVKSKDHAWEYTSALLNVFLTCLIIVCGVLIIFAPLFVKFTAPGFSQEKQETTVMLMRIMFLSPIILGLSNIVSGILQVFHRFLVTALAPLMYNLGIIIGIVFFVPLFGIKVLAFGVVLGGLLHLIIQIPAFLHSGFKYKRIFNFGHEGVLKTLKLMIPRSLGLGAGQINTIATTAIASTLLAGSVAVFNWTNNFSNMIISVIGVSLSTAMFPSLSLAYLKENKREFEKKFTSTFLQMLFFMVPVGMLLFILRAQLVRIILGTGRFNWTDTRLTAACLGIFAIGLCGQGLIFLLSKTFYAAHNTKIPAIISVLTVAFNILMSLFLVWLLSLQGLFFNIVQVLLRLEGIDNIGVIGLALAFSVTGITEALLLLILLYKKYRIFNIKYVGIVFGKIIIATIISGILAFAVRQYLVYFNIVQLQKTFGVFLQLVLTGIVGLCSYIIVLYFLKSEELKNIKQLFFRP